MKWTEEMKNELIKLYQEYDRNQCAEIMGIPVKNVVYTIDRLRLKRPPHKKVIPPGTVHVRNRSGLKRKYIKIKDGYWLDLKIYVWINEIGNIPDGKKVGFKEDNGDYNKENLLLIDDLDNLRSEKNSEEKRLANLKKLMNREKLRKKYGMNPLTGWGKQLVQPYY